MFKSRFISVFLLMLILVILNGCSLSSEIDDSLDGDSQDLVPLSVTKVVEYMADFEGDGVKERVIYYKNQDQVEKNAEEDKFVLHEHIEVYGIRNDEWELKYEVVFPNDSYQAWPPKEEGQEFVMGYKVDPRITEFVKIVDVGNDAKEELFIVTDVKDEYLLVGSVNGGIQELEFPKGFDGKTPGMRFEDTGDFYGRLVSVRIDDGKIVEHWGGTCEGSNQPCYFFDFFISYEPQENKWSISKAQNVEKDEGEYQKYLDRYSDAMPWTGELSF